MMVSTIFSSVPIFELFSADLRTVFLSVCQRVTKYLQTDKLNLHSSVPVGKICDSGDDVFSDEDTIDDFNDLL